MDSIASILLILTDIFFGRLFMYVPPLCSIVGPLFWEPSIICKMYYVLLNHTRFSKSVAQIFMVLNRMSCVLSPLNYNQVWKRALPVVQALIILLPIGGTWNLYISRVFVIQQYGGFAMTYSRNVKWAALSLFQSIYILTALAFTVVYTSITLYKLLVLPERIKSAEKSLCFTSMFISVTFLLVAGTQILWQTCCDTEFLFSIMLLAFDSFTVGSAVIVVMVNKQLRFRISPWRASESTTNVVVVSTVPS